MFVNDVIFNLQPVKLPYHIDYYSHEVTASMSDKTEAAMNLQWPIPRKDEEKQIIKVESPCTIIDQGGKIIAWILLEAFSLERQVSLQSIIFPPM